MFHLDKKSQPSPNKTFFLDKKNYQSYQLTASDLPSLVSHLNKKHKIKIIINGETETGKAIIAKELDATPEAQKSDICLNPQEARIEIKSIQSHLKENESVGYVFTSNHRIKADHMEMVIITKKAIIQPIKFNAKIFSEKTLYNADNYLIPHPAGISPQSDKYACGTLSLLYLKELLKNDAKQLNELCLMFPYYSEGEFGTSFAFIPSPNVLRYSQSNKYNQYIEKLFGDTDYDYITISEDKKITVKTLKKLLTDSMEQALKLKDTSTYEVNKNILDSLSKFKKKWLEDYKKSSIKRSQMISDDGLNKYLLIEHKNLKRLLKLKYQTPKKNSSTRA